jgi:hypothetical protein
MDREEWQTLIGTETIQTREINAKVRPLGATNIMG